MHGIAQQVGAHDDHPPDSPRNVSAISPASQFERLAQAVVADGVTIVTTSGWLDGGNANAAINRFRALQAAGAPRARNNLVLGAFQVSCSAPPSCEVCADGPCSHDLGAALCTACRRLFHDYIG